MSSLTNRTCHNSKTTRQHWPYECFNTVFHMKMEKDEKTFMKRAAR